ncbi:hypothetical protein EV368DRAFT_90232 [Lentinula lateritia]|nr:hypothetical protein EV368DRAFT_90232 [Lentinula lateritia]
MAFGFEGVLLRGVLLSYALVQQSQVQQCSMCTCSNIKLIKPMPSIHRPICIQEYDKQPMPLFLDNLFTSPDCCLIKTKIFFIMQNH